MNIVEQDLINLAKDFPFKQQLIKKNVLVTGGTGLIGSLIVKFLDVLNLEGLDIGVYSTVRSLNKTKNISLFGEVVWIEQDLNQKIDETLNIDYIFHTACPTQSTYLLNHPVEVITESITGAENVFRYAQKHKSSVVYLSSMEIYGQIFSDGKVDETNYGYLNHLSPRSGYPESKKIIECMATSFYKEYDTDIKIARLTQTFGAGIRLDDKRIFAQVASAAIEGNDIVLHTNGLSSKNYIYTTDAINALFYILLKGEKGEAYNIANPETYCSIKSLAEFVIDNFNKNIKIVYDIEDKYGYAPDTKVDLDINKLKRLGWEPKTDLYTMFVKLIEYLKEKR